MQHKQENKLQAAGRHREPMTSSVTHSVCMAWSRQGEHYSSQLSCNGDRVSHQNGQGHVCVSYQTYSLKCTRPPSQNRRSFPSNLVSFLCLLVMLLRWKYDCNNGRAYDNMQEKCILVLAIPQNGDKSINYFWVITVIICALDSSVSCLQITIHNNEAENWYFCLGSVVQCNGLYFSLSFFPLLWGRENDFSVNKKSTYPDMTLERHLIILWLRNMYQSLSAMKNGFRVVRQQLIDSGKWNRDCWGY